MKNFLVCILAIGLFFLTTNSAQAQSIKKYSGKTSVQVPDGPYGPISCQENYDYYISNDGSYVKSGNYTLKGSANQVVGTVNETYNVTATYKDGLLNGHLTAKVIAKGRGEWSYVFHDYSQFNVERTLSANFKDGVPDGQWTYSETGMLYNDKNIYKTSFSCKNGVWVGDFNCNFSSISLPPHLNGKFDQDGNLLSLTIQYKDGTEEYHLNQNRVLLSYFQRDENNKAIDNFKYDETLQQEYDLQSQSSLKDFIKENGYYLTQKTSQKSLKFSTLDILDYIWEQLGLQKTIDGVKKSNVFFSSYQYNIIDIKRVPVKPLEETQLHEIFERIRADFNSEYRGYKEGMSKESVLAKCKENYQIYKDSGGEFIKLRDTVRYFDETQSAYFQESVFRIWDEVLDNKRLETKKKIVNEAKAKITAMMDELVAWPVDAYKEKCPYYEQSLYNYYNSRGKKIWEDFNSKDKDGHSETEERIISKVKTKFKKFHKVVSYNIIDARVSDNFDSCSVSLMINKKNSARVGYQTFQSEALFSNSKDTWNNSWIVHLDVQKSFEKAERVYNVWDTVFFLKDTAYDLDKQMETNKKSFKSVYESYSDYDNAYKGDKENPQVQYAYWQNTISIIKGYLRFIELIKEINSNSDKIVLNAKDESDIAKSYQDVRKTWSMEVNGKIMDEIKRLEGYGFVQDSCLKFIELRKTITQNNTKIAGFSKAAPTIVKAYNTYMKGTDLSWNQEPGRNQAVREIINTQNALLKVLSQPNISETDKTVKKSKAKSWEDVKKNIFQ